MTTILPHGQKRPERRKSVRLDVDSAARLHVGSMVLEGRLENISASGAAFVTRAMDAAIEIGSRVLLVASDAGDDGQDLQLECHVLRIEEYFDGENDSRSCALGFDQPIDV